MTRAAAGFAILCCLLAAWPVLAQIGDTRARPDKACAICHLEWAAQSSPSKDFVLLESGDKPVVAESDNCLGCHDGSVSDSRRQVWQEHGHRTGIPLGKEMKTPHDLPLENGELVCRTCHTAHVSGFNESLKDAVFLRMKNDQDQLCKTCHEDKTKGPQLGSHSLASMESPFPAELLAAGAHAGPKNNQVLCQSCHTAHGSSDTKLLLMPTNASQLCITCHPTLRPAMWDSNSGHHPQNPLITRPDQIQAIHDMKTELGEGNRLVCLSCHKVHDAHPGGAILADTLQDSAMCIRCHADLKPMLGSGHDLRKSAPAERNTKSETAQQSGPCAACHTFHLSTRKLSPAPGDPLGLCSTCHSKDQVASSHVGKMLHPIALNPNKLPGKLSLPLFASVTEKGFEEMACTSCHDPHETKHPNFLRAPPEQLCATCHAEPAKSLSEPHDFSATPQLKNARGQSPQQAGRCGFCHSMHEAKGPMMLASADRPFKTMDDACVGCHATDGMAAKHPLAKFNHPTGPTVKLSKPIANLSLPLFGADFKLHADGSVACSSCHDVHIGTKQSKGLLRAGTPTALCTTCHTSQAKMAGGLHDPKVCKKPFPAKAAKTDDLCLTCHRAHSDEPAKALWTVALAPQMPAADGACVACHRDQNWSKAPKATHEGELLHPQQVPIASEIARIDQTFPLIKSDKPDQPATLICSTCHDPHAPPKTSSLLRTLPEHQATDVCAQCHVETGQIASSMHRPEEMTDHISRQAACAPCHQVHASPGIERKFLWSTSTFAKGATESERLCLGCHSTKGGARALAVFSHPKTNLKDLKIAATSRPSLLVEKFGRIDQLTCNTCHLTHGLDVPNSGGSLAGAHSPESLEGLKTMLRPNVDREICASCHGADAPRLYLYFHDASKRKGGDAR